MGGTHYGILSILSATIESIPANTGTTISRYLYMEDDDWMDEYLNNPELERNMYRMGYHPDRSDMRMDGMNRQQSRYGETYDRYSENRRHYHDSKDADSKQKMDSSMKEYTQDVIRTMSEMWSDADATLRQQMKTDLTKLLQQMN